MPEYRVEWVIDVTADTPEEAVIQAVSMLPGRKADTTATVFDVRTPAGATVASVDWADLTGRA